MSGIQTLNMSYCDQAGITDAAFAHLGGIQELDIDGCLQDEITGATFGFLVGICELTVDEARPDLRDAAQALGLNLR